MDLKQGVTGTRLRKNEEALGGNSQRKKRQI
jgi:hypothetical protein